MPGGSAVTWPGNWSTGLMDPISNISALLNLFYLYTKQGVSQRRFALPLHPLSTPNASLTLFLHSSSTERLVSPHLTPSTLFPTGGTEERQDGSRRHLGRKGKHEVGQILCLPLSPFFRGMSSCLKMFFTQLFF